MTTSPSPSSAIANDFARGLALYTRGAYWDAHEAWETAWRFDRTADCNDFLQGLIQVAAAFHKLYVQQRPRNAAAILARAIARLERYPSPYFGIDLRALVDTLRERTDRMASMKDGTSVTPGLAPVIEIVNGR